MGLQSELHRIDTSHQVALARIEQKLDNMIDTVSSTKTKVEDLTKWRLMIIGGAATLGVIGGILLTLGVKFGDKVSFSSEPQPNQVAQQKPANPTKIPQKSAQSQ